MREAGIEINKLSSFEASGALPTPHFAPPPPEGRFRKYPKVLPERSDRKDSWHKLLMNDVRYRGDHGNNRSCRLLLTP